MKTVDMLTKMHDENRADHADLTKKVETGFERLTTAFALHSREDDARFGAIQLELQPLRQLHASVKWTKRTIIGGILTIALDMFFHLMRGFK